MIPYFSFIIFILLYSYQVLVEVFAIDRKKTRRWQKCVSAFSEVGETFICDVFIK